MLQFDKQGTTSAAADAAAADLSHRYLWGPGVDQLLADEQVTDLQTAGTVLWPLGDQLGSVRDVVNNSGFVRIHRVFDAYGNIVATELRNASSEIVTAGQEGALLELFGFTARPFDVDTALQNNLHRWYDLSTGRWMSEDAIGFEAEDGSLFRYVGNNPTNRTDPTGRDNNGGAYEVTDTDVLFRVAGVVSGQYGQSPTQAEGGQIARQAEMFSWVRLDPSSAVCNSIQTISPDPVSVHGGTLKAYIRGQTPGDYAVTFTYWADLRVTSSCGHAMVTLIDAYAGRHNSAFARAIQPAGEAYVWRMATRTIHVTVLAGGAETWIATLEPQMRNSAWNGTVYAGVGIRIVSIQAVSD